MKNYYSKIFMYMSYRLTMSTTSLTFQFNKCQKVLNTWKINQLRKGYLGRNQIALHSNAYVARAHLYLSHSVSRLFAAGVLTLHFKWSSFWHRLHHYLICFITFNASTCRLDWLRPNNVEYEFAAITDRSTIEYVAHVTFDRSVYVRSEQHQWYIVALRSGHRDEGRRLAAARPPQQCVGQDVQMRLCLQ